MYFWNCSTIVGFAFVNFKYFEIKNKTILNIRCDCLNQKIQKFNNVQFWMYSELFSVLPI